MESVEIEFTALPAHVRTARLVASAVARQCGVDEAVLDEVRLAVGEACSRAVELHAREAPDRPVMVIFADAPGRFTVAIRDRLPVASAQAVAASAAAATAGGDGRLSDQPGEPRVASAQAVAASAAAATPGGDGRLSDQPGDPVLARSSAEEPDETEIRLAVLTGLVDDLEIEPLETGTEIRMSWPASGRLRTGARPLIPR
jgi:serine/threonine-protein kinase RsbW